MIEIRRYSNTDKPIWDDFVKRSKNATFMHLRDYMDYHADRFADFSLMAFNHHGKLVAVMPANIVGSTLYSHQGLTYGGWLTPVKHFTAVTMLEVWDAMMSFLKENGIRTLVYKAIPYIYHRYPADEDLYALFRHGAQIAECNISTAVALTNPAKYNETQRLQILGDSDFLPQGPPQCHARTLFGRNHTAQEQISAQHTPVRRIFRQPDGRRMRSIHRPYDGASAIHCKLARRDADECHGTNPRPLDA